MIGTLFRNFLDKIIIQSFFFTSGENLFLFVFEIPEEGDEDEDHNNHRQMDF